MKSLITVRGMLSYNDQNIDDSARPLRKDNNENTTMWSTSLATMRGRVFDYDTVVNWPIVGWLGCNQKILKMSTVSL